VTTYVNLEPSQLVGFIREMRADLENAMQDALEDAGGDMVPFMRARVIAEKKVDTGDYSMGWAYITEPKTLWLRNSEPQATFVEFGRRPGAKMPPAGALLGWMFRHNWTGSEYLLRRKIARDGIAPMPIVSDAVPELTAILMGKISTSFDRMGIK
jgi:hypothetical protein